jgi:CBS domain containing-hemolysin-like protein
MIELRDAIAKGKEFLLEVYGQPEEIILDSAKSDDNCWLVKFRVPINSLQNVLGINKRIFYKTVKVDENGEIIEIIDGDLPQDQPTDIQPQAV